MMDTQLMPRQAPDRVAGCSILVVDDSRTHRKLVESSLRQAGFRRVSFAVDGQQALDTVRSEPPDLVLLDLVMPVLDGFGVCQALRRQPEYSDIPILVMTSLESVEHRLRALSAGATDVILKPVYQPQLVTHAISHLERRVLIRGLREYQERTAAELAIARHMQEGLLPDANTLRQVQDRYGLEIGAIFEPSAEIGGDLWGLWPIDVSRLGVFACDVSGHGTIAAINTFRIHTILARNDFDRAEPGRFLSALNDRLIGLMSSGQYATMLYAVLDMKRETFSYAAAGCPEPVLALPLTPVRGLDGSGLPLGIVSGVQYPTRHAPFPPGASIVLHSDALTEARLRSDDSLLGESRAHAFVSKALASNAPQKAVVDVFAAVKELAGQSLDDDLTLICISRADGEAGPAAATEGQRPGEGSARVLAVAQSLSQRLMVKRAALTAGLDSDGATDLAGAGRFLAENSYSIVFIDLRLPRDELLELLATVAAAGVSPRLVLAGAPSPELLKLAASLSLHVTATLPAALEIPPLREALLAGLPVRESRRGGDPFAALNDADLTRGLLESEVTFSFQPQLSLATGKIVAAEALARWASPEYGIVPPNIIGTIATGPAARLLSDATLRAATKACAEWRATVPSMRVAVNLSTASLLDPALPEMVEERLRDACMPPSALIVEVSEADAVSCGSGLLALRDLGVCIALDEFGSGGASLLAIEQLPASMLKLSRSLVRRCVADPAAKRMLHAALAVAGTLGLTVGAVGIENYAVEQTLRAAGCELGQGWLYGPALPAAAFSDLLGRQKPEATA